MAAMRGEGPRGQAVPLDDHGRGGGGTGAPPRPGRAGPPRSAGISPPARTASPAVRPVPRGPIIGAGPAPVPSRAWVTCATPPGGSPTSWNSIICAARPRQESIPVELGGRTRFIDPGAVWFAEARGDYVRLRTAEGGFLVRTSMAALEQRWAGAGFIRAHRSTLVERPARERAPVRRRAGVAAGGDRDAARLAAAHPRGQGAPYRSSRLTRRLSRSAGVALTCEIRWPHGSGRSGDGRIRPQLLGSAAQFLQQVDVFPVLVGLAGRLDAERHPGRPPDGA